MSAKKDKKKESESTPSSLGHIMLTVLEKSRRTLLNLSRRNPEDSPSNSKSSGDIVIEISSRELKQLGSPAIATRSLNMRRVDSLDDLIMAPSNDYDQIFNLNALLLAHRNSVKFDTKCFEMMYEKAVWMTKWMNRLIHLIGFLTLILSLAGVAQLDDMQPYIVGTMTLLFGMNGYKDHEHLESGVEALDQCVNFTNEIYTDINYFLYRSNHTIEALNVFVSAIDDKLKIFDRTTRLPIPINVKNNVLDIVKIEKQVFAENQQPSVNTNPRSIYAIKRKHKSPNGQTRQQ
jgi:hypothetical protein